jgi:prophage maintenance system killer protein
LRRPSLQLAIEINKRIRGTDEWFDEPDDLDRVESALRSVEDLDDPVEAAGLIVYRVTRAQGFAEGNKRTALLLARWVLDNNQLDGRQFIDPDDRNLADLLVQAALGRDVELQVLRFFQRRA